MADEVDWRQVLGEDARSELDRVHLALMEAFRPYSDDPQHWAWRIRPAVLALLAAERERTTRAIYAERDAYCRGEITVTGPGDVYDRTAHIARGESS